MSTGSSTWATSPAFAETAEARNPLKPLSFSEVKRDRDTPGSRLQVMDMDFITQSKIIIALCDAAIVALAVYGAVITLDFFGII